MPFDTSNPALIYVSGNNGSGKTTLSKKLAKSMGFLHPSEQEYDKSYLFDLFAQQRRWSFETQIHFLVLKAATLRTAISRSTRVILDRSPYEDAEVFAKYFYETGKMDRRSYQTYQKLYESLLKDLPDPALVLHCRCSVGELQRRVVGRGREYEELYPPDHLELLESLYQTWIRRIDRRFPGRVMTIDSEAIDFRTDFESIAMIAAEVLDALESPQLTFSFDRKIEQAISKTPRLLKPPAFLRRSRIPRRRLKVYLAAPFTGKATEASIASLADADTENDSTLFDFSAIQRLPHGKIQDDEYRSFLESVEQMIRACGFDTFLPHRDINRWGERVLSAEKAAAECTKHVFAADVLVALPQISLGAHYEIGVAIGYGLPVIILIRGNETTGFLTPGLSSIVNTTVIHFERVEELRTRLSAALTDLAEHPKA